MFRSRRDSDWSLTNVGALSGLSLFDHATRLVAEHGDGPLPCGGEPLPDEPPPDPSKLRYGPGVMDGIGAVRAGPGDGQPAVVAASAILDMLKAAPHTKAWMLRGGYVSGVMDEEVAYIAASTGGLAEALVGAVDEELLDWSGRLLVALAMGGPAKDMSHYTDGATTLGAYLREVGNVSATLLRLQHLYDIERYLTGWAAENPFIDDGTRQALSAQVTAILDRPDWAPFVAGGLVSTDIATVKDVLRLAPRYELDPVPVILEWLAGEPHDALLWQTVLAGATADNIDELVTLAGRVLPWSAIKTGPAKDFGRRADYRAEACLDQNLQRLNKFPGHGWEAIELGLTCRRSDERASHDVRPEKAHHPAGKNATCAQLPGVRTIMVP